MILCVETYRVLFLSSAKHVITSRDWEFYYRCFSKSSQHVKRSPHWLPLCPVSFSRLCHLGSPNPCRAQGVHSNAISRQVQCLQYTAITDTKSLEINFVFQRSSTAVITMPWDTLKCGGTGYLGWRQLVETPGAAKSRALVRACLFLSNIQSWTLVHTISPDILFERPVYDMMHT